MTDMDLSGDYAPGWRPNEGDTLVGEITDIDRGWSDQGGNYYPILTIKKDDGERVAIHAFHFTLKREILSYRPQIGETIGVKYKGKVKTKDGRRTVAVYVFKVKGRSRDIYGDIEDPAAGGRRPTPTPSTDIPVSDDDFATSSGAAADDDDIPF